MKIIDEIYTEHLYFEARRMPKHLVPYGIIIGRKICKSLLWYNGNRSHLS